MIGTGDTTFSPLETADRAMVVTTIYRIAKNAGLGFQGAWAFPLPFTDASNVPDYAFEATAWCSMNDIVGGFEDGRFAPNDPITREQFVTILYRFAQVMGYDVSVDENTNFLSFTDFWDVSEYAKPAMMWAIENGIVEGDDTGSLLPADSANRAQMAALLQRFCEKVIK